MNENKPHDPLQDAILRVIQNISEDVKMLNELKKKAKAEELMFQQLKSGAIKEYNWVIIMGIIGVLITLAGMTLLISYW